MKNTNKNKFVSDRTSLLICIIGYVILIFYICISITYDKKKTISIQYDHNGVFETDINNKVPFYNIILKDNKAFITLYQGVWDIIDKKTIVLELEDIIIFAQTKTGAKVFLYKGPSITEIK